ncbi:LacI family DNA-binding transcriptional regulator [Cellvibrio sp. NN19]|uniref:LacI family DNA-binding transcriptional regulator n=1 Tax=Cellvibrio chitinivorans TaxID=3102792 RepID=UPI002B41601C|nr:LacI family DNA-binding transcriptional regulator [Cellvibrio sp. NN19]
MIGIKDIAKEARVSPATVSRVLRNPELVTEDKRTRVLEAVKRTGYTPNSLGVSLRMSKTYNLVAIIPDAISVFNYPVIRAIESIALEKGYSLLLGDTQEKESRERSFANMVRSRQADGILLFCSRLPFDIDPERGLAEQLPPLVNACEPVDIEGIPSVNIDNSAAAEDAVNYLLSLGHKRIGVIAGNMAVPSTQSRMEGYKNALQKAGIAFDEQLVEIGNYALSGAAEATYKLTQLTHPPTAIFAFSDEMGMSCISTLHKMGFKIPQDFSVMGFDNIRYAEYCSPSLTTIAQPMTEIGIACMELLLPQLNGEPMIPIKRILPHQLMIRESTGPAPKSD